MKPEFDKEMEMLLRGHMGAARRDAASRATAAAAHLDADELSAYAENALPAETRARYVAHLADCDNCRKLATSIALAAGVAGELEKRAAAPPSPASGSLWRERLAALFAPRTLRYVSPVLALLLIGIIAFVATRTSRDGTLVVERTTTEQPQSVTAPSPREEAEQKSEMAPSTATESARDTSSPAATEAARSVPLQDARPTANAREGALAGASTGATAAPEPPSTATVEALPAPLAKPDDLTLRAKQENRPVAAPSEGAGSAPFLASKEKAQKKDEDAIARTAQPEQSAAQKRAADEEREVARTDEVVTTTNSSGRKAAPPPASPSKPSAGALAARGVRRQRSETSKDESARSERDDSATEAQTRTVASRRFRRQGGAWVDTAYNSSMATTNVRRNSEQYRALVADEPELGRIADQLGGEVVVVWKGRAYRIR